MRGDEALSCRDVEGILGVPASQARAVVKQRVAQGDTWPLQIRGTWLAPLDWWRKVLDIDMDQVREEMGQAIADEVYPREMEGR